MPHGLLDRPSGGLRSGLFLALASFAWGPAGTSEKRIGLSPVSLSGFAGIHDGGIAAEDHVWASVDSMLTLNERACQAMLALEVHACTDVSDFGLIGHARELALASGVTLEIEPDRIEFLTGA